MDPATKRAVEAIGRGHWQDYVLEPQVHVKSLDDGARPLREVLQRDRIRRVMSNYEKQDADALRAQQRYLRWRSLEIWIGVLAIVCGALLATFPPSSWPSGLAVAPTVEFFMILGVLALFLIASGITWLIDPSKHQRLWLQHRADAEKIRHHLFEEVIREDKEARGMEIPILPLQLEYFRRYQIDVQRAYFAARMKAHERAANRVAAVRLGFAILPALAAVGLILVALAPLTEADQKWAILQGLSAWVLEWPEIGVARLLLFVLIAAAAISSGWTAQSMVNNNRRNARRFANTLASLEAQVAHGLEPARHAAATGNRQDVQRFVWGIHQLLGAELQEWTVISDKLDILKGPAPGRAPSEQQKPS